MIYISYIALSTLALLFMAFCGWILKNLLVGGGLIEGDEARAFREAENKEIE